MNRPTNSKTDQVVLEAVQHYKNPTFPEIEKIVMDIINMAGPIQVRQSIWRLIISKDIMLTNKNEFRIEAV